MVVTSSHPVEGALDKDASGDGFGRARLTGMLGHWAIGPSPYRATLMSARPASHNLDKYLLLPPPTPPTFAVADGSSNKINK